MMRRLLKYFMPEPVKMQRSEEEIRSIALVYAQQKGSQLTEPIGITVWDSTKGWLQGPEQGPVWHVCDNIRWYDANRHLLIDDKTGVVLKSWFSGL